MYKWCLFLTLDAYGLLFPAAALPPLASFTRTRPGFAQSFGWILCASNTGLRRSAAQAEAISRARGFFTARDLDTRRPSARERVASKYTGYSIW